MEMLKDTTESLERGKDEPGPYPGSEQALKQACRNGYARRNDAKGRMKSLPSDRKYASSKGDPLMPRKLTRRNRCT